MMIDSSPHPLRIAVFCASSMGTQAHYIETARLVGQTLAQRNIDLVYGGASVGLMGVVADGALAAGGRVIGVIPRRVFENEPPHLGLTELHEVATMHERKALMAHLSEGFLALPGGFGTFDETIEMITWNHLGIHRKPVGVLDVDGYFDAFFEQIERAIDEGFIPRDSLQWVTRAPDIETLLTAVLSKAA
jgi:hypothetical protein